MKTEPRGVATRSLGVGMVGDLVIRMVAKGKQSEADLRVALKSHVSGQTVGEMLQAMCKERLLSRAAGGFVLGTRGRAYMATNALGLAPMAPYRPPRPPFRRAGSDTSHIPSRVAGEAIPHRHPI